MSETGDVSGTTAIAPVPRLLYSVEEAAQALGIRRTKMYDLLRARDVVPVHIGRRTLVSVAALETYIARLRADASADIIVATQG